MLFNNEQTIQVDIIQPNTEVALSYNAPSKVTALINGITADVSTSNEAAVITVSGNTDIIKQGYFEMKVQE